MKKIVLIVPVVRCWRKAKIWRTKPRGRGRWDGQTDGQRPLWTKQPPLPPHHPRRCRSDKTLLLQRQTPRPRRREGRPPSRLEAPPSRRAAGAEVAHPEPGQGAGESALLVPHRRRANSKHFFAASRVPHRWFAPARRIWRGAGPRQRRRSWEIRQRSPGAAPLAASRAGRPAWAAGWALSGCMACAAK